MEGFPFPVEVVRTKRKRSASIGLSGAGVKVTVPASLSESRIRDLVIKRTPWINRKLQEQSERPVTVPREFVSGETVTYLGKNYRLKVLKGDCSSIKMLRGYIQVTVPETDTDPRYSIRMLLADWYKSHAATRLKDKTQRYSQIVGVSPNSVSIKNYKSMWGSCTSLGDISYNWRIILAPHSVVDYVVVHELCHMLEHNHSPKYWREVEKHIPDWRRYREWLKHNELATDL
ncbi:M48 family metallopeptidase [Luminiphilus sp.]|nr:M48 family metallopeptidase [Luminiphilus sp.]